MNTAVIYVRKSSDETEKNTSLQTQAKACLRYAHANGLDVSDEYTYMENFTGMVIDRPELSKVRAAVRNGEVQHVIVYSHDRFSRNPIDAELLLREFWGYSVELHITNHGVVKNAPEDLLMFGIQGQFAYYWRNKIIEATQRGKRAKLERGLPVGSGKMVFGYALVGKGEDQRLEHVPEERAVIESVFNNFVLEGRTALQIADMFNATNVATRASRKKGFNLATGKWTGEQIYQILHNEAYVGTMYANRWNGDGSQKPREEWIEIAVPPMIDPEIFEMAQAKLAEGRSKHARKGIYEYLAARRMRCRHCGNAMVGRPSSSRGKVYLRYVCPFSTERRLWYGKPKCDMKSTRAYVIDAALREWVLNLLANPDAMLSTYNDAQAAINAELKEVLDTVDSYDRVIASFKEQLTRYAELYAEGSITKDLYREKKALLDEKIREGNKQKAEYERRLALNKQRITDRDIQNAASWAQDVNRSLARGEEINFQRLRKIIEDLDITVELAIEDGVQVMYIQWANYEERKPIGGDDMVCSVLPSTPS